MNKLYVVGTALLALLIIAVVGWKMYPEFQNNSNNASASEAEAAVRETVTGFGDTLKNVSLLAPTAEVTQQIQTQYSPYVSASLLAMWQGSPEDALGRSVSSPWPERIDIVSVTKQTDTSYKVEGNVVEVTSDTAAPAGVYPVVLQVEKQEGSWVITQATKGTYSELPKRMSVQGVLECLPHKDTSGPQTMECAFGIAANQNSIHYALDVQLLANPTEFPTGTPVKVEGVFTPVNQLSSNTWQKYPIEGVISASSISKL